MIIGLGTIILTEESTKRTVVRDLILNFIPVKRKIGAMVKAHASMNTAQTIVISIAQNGTGMEEIKKQVTGFGKKNYAPLKKKNKKKTIASLSKKLIGKRNKKTLKEKLKTCKTILGLQSTLLIKLLAKTAL
jgi:hypothetical protein